MNFRLPRGGIVGIIGPNGAGKTTLFRMITGQEQPDGGTIRIGDTVALGYVDQSRDALKPDQTSWEAFSDGQETIQLGKINVNSRAYVARFNFSGSDQQKKLSMLSGGERNRLLLARLFLEGANVLVLDEPTNDLDLVTLNVLERLLLDFQGSVLLVTHDRYFLDKVATAILAFEGDGRATRWEGNYADLVARRGKCPIPSTPPSLSASASSGPSSAPQRPGGAAPSAATVCG